TASATGRTPATSASFDITTGAAAALQVLTQPRDTVAGAGLSGPTGVRVRVVDSQGNPIAGATNSIALSLTTNPTGDVLQGTTSVNASGGIAAFPGVFLRKAATGYVIGASASGLSSANSGSFAISAGGASQLAL